MLFQKKKKEENTDEFHKDYGTFSNCRFVLGKVAKYRKSALFFIATGAIAGAALSYLWSFIGKLVIDMIERQASGDGNILPLLYLTLGTAAVGFFLMWLNNFSNLKTNLGFHHTRRMIVLERLQKVMDMEYESLETPEMLDRLRFCRSLR